MSDVETHGQARDTWRRNPEQETRTRAGARVEGPSFDEWFKRATGNGPFPYQRRFARGIWDDDELLATELGGGVTAPAARLSLEPMELGLCEQEPFIGRASWAEGMIRLRDDLGPFLLAYLEAILRAADMRASREADKRSFESPAVEEEAP